MATLAHLLIASAVLCMPPPPPDNIPPEVIAAAKARFETQTAQEQVASRTSVSACATCHKEFDPYGLVLENYDTLGRWRDNDPDLAGMLQGELGGQGQSWNTWYAAYLNSLPTGNRVPASGYYARGAY